MLAVQRAFSALSEYCALCVLSSVQVKEID